MYIASCTSAGNIGQCAATIPAGVHGIDVVTISVGCSNSTVGAGTVVGSPITVAVGSATTMTGLSGRGVGDESHDDDNAIAKAITITATGTNTMRCARTKVVICFMMSAGGCCGCGVGGTTRGADCGLTNGGKVCDEDAGATGRLGGAGTTVGLGVAGLVGRGVAGAGRGGCCTGCVGG